MACIKLAPRGFESLKANSHSLDKQQLTQNQNPVLSTCLDKSLQKHPELGQIITAWPELSEKDRKAILDIVKG